MRWRWPPLNSCGEARHGGGIEADGFEQVGNLGLNRSLSTGDGALARAVS